MTTIAPIAAPTTTANGKLWGEVDDAVAKGEGVTESTSAATGMFVSWAQLPAMALALA
jgi:hypothetical protein